jgi:hypothetical protein
MFQVPGNKLRFFLVRKIMEIYEKIGVSLFATSMFSTLLISIHPVAIWILVTLRFIAADKILSKKADYIDGAGHNVYKRVYFVNGEFANGFIFVRLLLISFFSVGIPLFVTLLLSV